MHVVEVGDRVPGEPFGAAEPHLLRNRTNGEVISATMTLSSTRKPASG